MAEFTIITLLIIIIAALIGYYIAWIIFWNDEILQDDGYGIIRESKKAYLKSLIPFWVWIMIIKKKVIRLVDEYKGLDDE